MANAIAFGIHGTVSPHGRKLFVLHQLVLVSYQARVERESSEEAFWNPLQAGNQRVIWLHIEQQEWLMRYGMKALFHRHCLSLCKASHCSHLAIANAACADTFIDAREMNTSSVVAYHRQIGM